MFVFGGAGRNQCVIATPLCVTASPFQIRHRKCQEFLASAGYIYRLKAVKVGATWFAGKSLVYPFPFDTQAKLTCQDGEFPQSRASLGGFMFVFFCNIIGAPE
jgi:hypothetical protein